MTGDASILDCQSVFDFFTATIFACTGHCRRRHISVPMLLIQLTLAARGDHYAAYHADDAGDFSAVGGMLLVATGLVHLRDKNVCRSEDVACAGAGDADFRGLDAVFCLKTRAFSAMW
ncbi:DUF554 family protein [Klebsiella pneumoniae]|nr:DUF554 family protein [Klebsiella pneumoniae]